MKSIKEKKEQINKYFTTLTIIKNKLNEVKGFNKSKLYIKSYAVVKLFDKEIKRDLEELNKIDMLKIIKIKKLIWEIKDEILEHCVDGLKLNQVMY